MQFVVSLALGCVTRIFVVALPALVPSPLVLAPLVLLFIFAALSYI